MLDIKISGIMLWVDILSIALKYDGAVQGCFIKLIIDVESKG